MHLANQTALKNCKHAELELLQNKCWVTTYYFLYVAWCLVKIIYLQGKILTSLFLNLFTGKLALTNLLGLAFMLARRWNKEKEYNNHLPLLMKQICISFSFHNKATLILWLCLVFKFYCYSSLKDLQCWRKWAAPTIALDKVLFSTNKNYLYFSYCSIKTYVVGTH